MRFRRRLTQVRRFVSHTERDTHDVFALQALAPLRGEFLPWTSFSMRPSVILAILSDIAVNRRTHIVECGSGNSTLFIARLIRSHEIPGAHVVSIDHEPQWAELTRQALHREGLDDLVTICVAPLTAGWYERSALPSVEEIDLLIVDGPPALAEKVDTARAPALGHFKDALVHGAAVFLDDADRPGERQVLAAWERDFGLEFELQRGGFAIAYHR